MSPVIVIVAEDISVKSNGNGGYELSFYGNNRWWYWTLKSVHPTDLTTAINSAVSQLNAVPITSKKPKIDFNSVTIVPGSFEGNSDLCS